MPVRKIKETGRWQAEFNYTDENGDTQRKRKNFRYKSDAANWLLEKKQNMHRVKISQKLNLFICSMSTINFIKSRSFVKTQNTVGI